MPQRAGGGVARVGERRLAGLGPRGVELLERLGREEHLAAHLDVGRHRVLLGAGQPVRDDLDRADVGGDVLADPAVAAGDAAGQHAVLVRQRDRQAVDLELAQELGLRRRPRGGSGRARTRAPRARTRCRGSSCRSRCSYASNVDDAHAADLLRRRVGRAELGQLLLEALELADQLVVLVVGDDRCVVAVIARADAPRSSRRAPCAAASGRRSPCVDFIVGR